MCDGLDYEAPNVRYGSLTDISRSGFYVRSTPDNGRPNLRLVPWCAFRLIGHTMVSFSHEKPVCTFDVRNVGLARDRAEFPPRIRGSETR